MVEPQMILKTLNRLGMIGVVLGFLLLTTSCKEPETTIPEPFELNDTQGRAFVEEFMQSMFSLMDDRGLITFNRELYIQFSGIPDSWIPDHVHGQKIVKTTEDEFVQLLLNRDDNVDPHRLHTIKFEEHQESTKFEELNVFIKHKQDTLHKIRMGDHTDEGYPILHFNSSPYTRTGNSISKEIPYFASVVAIPVQSHEGPVHMQWSESMIACGTAIHVWPPKEVEQNSTEIEIPNGSQSGTGL